MAVRQYIGARYIPLFADPIEWSAETAYEPLTVVTYQGGSYVSRQYVPAGIPLSNNNYWLLWADYNAQLEAYRQEVLRFDGRITANADAINDETNARTEADTQLSSDLAAETSAREAADTALENAVDDIPVVAATDFFPTDKSDVPLMFPYNNPGYDYGTEETEQVHRIVFGEDNSLRQALYAGGCNLVASGNLDICWVSSIANSYLMNADKFIYANEYTACSYEGTFDDPRMIDPKAHRDVNNKMQIDCRTFAELIAHGIPYSQSIYNQPLSSDLINGFHPAFNPTSAIVKEYWKHGPADTPLYNTNIGWGHMLSDSFAKFLYDAGRLEFVNPGTQTQIEPGYIYFEGGTTGRFFKISHCYVAVGSFGPLAYQTLIAESGSVNDVLNSRFLTASKAENTVARYMPPTSSNALRMGQGSTFQTYQQYYNARNLTTNPLTWNETNTTYAARVLSIKPTSTTSGTFKIRLTNNATNESMENTAFITGSTVYIIPYGWTVDLTATSGVSFDIITQCVCSDKLIKLA